MAARREGEERGGSAPLDGAPNAGIDALVPLVYADLRRIARQQLARLRPGNTLDTTALVHETYLRLAAREPVRAADRNHFFAIAARVMRDILVDETRRRAAGKRGGGSRPLQLERVELGVDDQVETLLAIDRALDRLSGLNERLTRVFECRFFAGLTEEETAAALELPLRTVQRDWMKSKAWLRRELGAV